MEITGNFEPRRNHIDDFRGLPPKPEGEAMPSADDEVRIEGTSCQAIRRVDPSILCSAPSFDLASSVMVGDAVTAALSPAPVAVPLAELLRKLQQKNVAFFKKRGFYIPLLMKKYRGITAEEAAKVLEGGSEKERAGLRVLVNDVTEIRGFTAADAQELALFQRIQPGSLPHGDLADFLNEAEAKKHEILNADDKPIGSFGAYRSLTKDSSAGDVHIRRNGIDLVAISPAQSQDIRQAKADYELMSRVAETLSYDKRCIQLATTPTDGFTIDEKAAALKKIADYSYDSKYEKRYSHAANDFEHIADITGSKKEAAALTGFYMQMLDAIGSAKRQDGYREGLDFISTRLKDHPEEFRAFIGLLSRGMSVATARAVHDNLPKPMNTGDYQKAAGLFVNNQNNSYFYWDPKKVAVVMKPLGELSLGERIDVMRNISLYSKDNRSTEKSWENTSRDYESFRSRTDGTSGELAKLYVNMLKARGSTYWKEDYCRGLDFIASRLKDHPDEFTAFTDMLSRGLSIATAQAVFDNLPQPVNTGDYKKAAELFVDNQNNSNFYWDPEKVAVVMKPFGELSLNDRIEKLREIYVHSKDDRSTKKSWKNTLNDYEALRNHTDGDSDELIQSYTEMLKARGSSYKREDYREGLDFITARLKDHPDEFRAFTSLLSRGVGVATARAIFDNLPQPVNAGDYEHAAGLFFDNQDNSYFYWDPEKVAAVMEPLGKLSLCERIENMKEIYVHSKDRNNSDKSWKNTSRDYQSLRNRTDRDTGELAKHYVDMLKAIGSPHWKDDYAGGLEFTAARLMDHPDEFRAFTGLLSRGVGIDAARAILDNLPQPIKAGDYEQAAGLFISNRDNSYFYWDQDKVATVMKPVEGLSLNERVDFLHRISINSNERDSGEKSWKHARNDYEIVSAGAGNRKQSFTWFCEILESRKSYYWDKGAIQCLKLVERDMAGDDRLYRTFLSLLSSTQNAGQAASIYELVAKPVAGEDMSTRLRAAEMLRGEKLEALYNMACHHIPQGETVEDSAALIACLLSLRRDCKTRVLEDLLGRVIEMKGDVKGVIAGDLIRHGSLTAPDPLLRLLALVGKGQFNEPAAERNDIFHSFFKTYYGERRSNFEEAVKSFETLAASLKPGEALAGVFRNFTVIHNALSQVKDLAIPDPRQATVESLDFLGRAIAGGDLGQCSIDEIIPEFIAELMLAKTFEQAKNSLLYKHNKPASSEVEFDDNVVLIGGIKLDVKPHKEDFRAH